MSDDSIPLKQCSRKDKCCNPLGCWLPATTEYFMRHATGRDGLRGRCRCCVNEWKRAYYTSNKERFQGYHEAYKERRYEYNKQYYADNRDRLRERNKNAYLAEREERLESQKAYYADNREEINKRRRARYRLRPEQKREQDRLYRERNKDQIEARRKARYIQNNHYIKARTREYRRRNRDHVRQQSREYYKKHTVQMRLYSSKRRSQKLNLPYGFSERDWKRCLEYFHHCCAVCGRQSSNLFNEYHLAQDHWIPVSDTRIDNPGTVPTNIVPLCHGVEGCNNSKNNKDPIKWLAQEFGKRKAKQILDRIEAYFEWVRTQNETAE